MKNDKELMVIIIIAFIVVVAITGCRMIMKKQYNTMPETIDGKTEEGQLLYSGISVFSEKYTGYMSRKDITDRLKAMITEELPEMYDKLKNADDKTISEYYESNKQELKENYGIESANEFTDMINILKAKNINLKEYDKLSINMETFGDPSDKPNYASAECEISYPGDNIIKFKAYISKKKSIKPDFIITFE